MSRSSGKAAAADFSSVVIVDNVPVVTQEKFEKLRGVMQKLLGGFQCTVVNFELCVDEESGSTLGYAFVEYASAAEAERAVAKLNNHRLDKNHVFQVVLFSDWERFKKTPATFSEPTVEDQKASDDLNEWLLDQSAREQYMVRYGDDTEVYWNDPIVLGRQTLVQKRTGWTDILARWSPLGSFLATFHPQGIQLWGGLDWRSLGRFAHPGVQLIDFSPREGFLVTWFNSLYVHEVKTQKRVKVFANLAPTMEHGWPLFKWSHDERFMANLMEDNINVYDTRTMKLVQPDPKKATTLYLPRVRDFEWSPTDNIICYWIPELGDQPARIVLVRVVESSEKSSGGEEALRKILFEPVTTRNIFRVSDARIHWQTAGNFLCVKVDRQKKDMKALDRLTSFELFRMRTKPVAIESVEVSEEVVAFAWEPCGHRFAVIHGSKPSMYSVSFYSMNGITDGKVSLRKSLPKKTANHLFWSPRGTHIVLAGLKNFNGVLEFWNTDEMEITGGGEHFMCTDVEWDPSGRFLATSVSYYRHQMENGYIIWSFQGKQILNLNRERLTQFMWRPRPPTLLTEAQLTEITETLTTRAARYQKEEQQLSKMEAEAIQKQRREKMDEFVALVRAR
eukprot:RCo037589